MQVNEAVVTGWLFFRYLVIGGKCGYHCIFFFFCMIFSRSHLLASFLAKCFLNDNSNYKWTVLSQYLIVLRIASVLI